MTIAQTFYEQYGYAPTSSQIDAISNGGDPFAGSTDLYTGAASTPVQGYVTTAPGSAPYYSTTNSPTSTPVTGPQATPPLGGYNSGVTGGLINAPVTGNTGSLVGNALTSVGQSTPSGSTPTMTSVGTTATGYQPASAYSASTYSPTDRTVNAANETVAGQFNNLTQSSNPLMQMARTGAAQQMNARGLINSSMAIGASDAAAYQAALPIAQADAATYSQASRDNQAYGNQASQFGAAARNDASRFNSTEKDQAAQFGATATNQASQFNAQATNDAAKTNLAMQEDLTKANLTADTQRAISSNDASKGVNMQLQQSVQMLQNNYATKLAEIMHDTTMSAEGKTAAKAQLDQWYNTSVSQQGSIAGVNVDSILVGI